ncbi:MAG TPA: WD40 repeat domain-containing protein [Oligoflexia bacterium]|nr:WD40 repeat domain-containing protein [Oligoflexia bacterium]
MFKQINFYLKYFAEAIFAKTQLQLLISELFLEPIKTDFAREFLSRQLLSGQFARRRFLLIAVLLIQLLFSPFLIQGCSSLTVTDSATNFSEVNQLISDRQSAELIINNDNIIGLTNKEVLESISLLKNKLEPLPKQEKYQKIYSCGKTYLLSKNAPNFNYCILGLTDDYRLSISLLRAQSPNLLVRSSQLFQSVPEQSIDNFAVSPDLAWITFVANGRELQVFSLRSGALVLRTARVPGKINTLEFSPDSRSILMSATDGKLYRIRFLDLKEQLNPLEQERLFERYISAASIVSASRFHPTGDIFFFGDWSGEITAFRTYTSDRFDGRYAKNIFKGRAFSSKGLLARLGTVGTPQISLIEISDDGNTLVFANREGALGVVDLRGFRHLLLTPLGRGRIKKMLITPFGKEVITLNRDRQIATFKIEKKKASGSLFNEYSLNLLKEHEGIYEDLALVDLDKFVALSADGNLKIFTIAAE